MRAGALELRVFVVLRYASPASGEDEKHGHSGMAEDLGLALIQLDEQVYSGPFWGKNDAGDVGYHREEQDV